MRACVILCGGKSSRMGQNKALLPFGHQSLLASLIAKYKESCDALYLCCKQEHQSQYQGLGADLILESSPIYSPMIGLEASLESLGREILTLCVDYPFLQKEHLHALWQDWHPSLHALYAQSPSKTHYLIGIYAPSILPSLKACLREGRLKISSWLQRCRTQSLSFQDEESFANLNTLEDYQRALARIEQGCGRGEMGEVEEGWSESKMEQG